MQLFTARISIFCAALIMLFMCHPATATASNPLDKLSDIQNTIKAKIKEVKEARKKENSISNKMEKLNSSIVVKERELTRYNKLISGSEAKIRGLNNDITELNKKLSARNRYLNERIRALHKRQYGGDALLLITAKDHQDLIQKSKYISMLAYYDNKIIKKYSSSLKEINNIKADMENVNSGLKANKDTIRKKKVAIQASLEKKDNMLTTVKNKRIAQEKKIQKLKESSQKLQKMVRKLKNRKMPDSIIGRGFKASKGDLPWPVSGAVLIPYGEYKDADLDATIFNNGMEISAKKGSKPAAVAGGRVVFADKFEGYGNLLIIDHGSGYHSLYGNLSETALNPGELLIAGMEVGTTSTSKKLNIPTLYFEIRFKGKPVNPTPWLK